MATAIVTGAGSPGGIGWATALEFGRRGFTVVVTDRPGVEHQLTSLVDELDGPGLSMSLDVTDRSQIDRCVEQTLSELGSIDVVVNNAGTTIGAAPFLELSTEQWDVSYEVNLRGPADVTQAALPHMIDRGSGSIVNVASTAGLGAEAGFGAYNATKHGLVGLTKTVAAEFGPAGVRCNAVCPGFVSTPMHLGATERLAAEAGVDVDEMARRRYETVALGRPGTVEEIAALIGFVAVDATYLTGAAIPVSGGTPVGL